MSDSPGSCRTLESIGRVSSGAFSILGGDGVGTFRPGSAPLSPNLDPTAGARFVPQAELDALSMPLLGAAAVKPGRASTGGSGVAVGCAAGGSAPEGGRASAVLRSMLYGVINAVVCAPVMIGFAAIIFRNPAFHRDPDIYPKLVKLVLFSSAVHQAVFVCFLGIVFWVFDRKKTQRFDEAAQLPFLDE